MLNSVAAPGIPTLNRHGRGRGGVVRISDRRMQLLVALMLTRCLLTSCFLPTTAHLRSGQVRHTGMGKVRFPLSCSLCSLLLIVIPKVLTSDGELFKL